MFDLPLPARVASVVAFGYAAGCLNAGYYLVRAAHGADLRSLHSGNAGATNAGRVLGRRGFVAVLALDAAKGALAATVGAWLVGYAGMVTGAVSAIAGHVWPAQLGFRGGIGVATLTGAFLVVEPSATLLTLGVAGLLYGATRAWTPSGLVAMAAGPVVALALGRPPRALVGLGLAVGLVLLAHREDVRQLVRRLTASASG